MAVVIILSSGNGELAYGVALSTGGSRKDEVKCASFTGCFEQVCKHDVSGY